MPRPKDTDWELELPEEQQETNGDMEFSEEDAAEKDQRNQALREAAEAAEFSRRTQVVQRALPRPPKVDIETLMANASRIPDVAEAAIAKEMALLIANDAFKYPDSGAKAKGTSRPLETFDDDALNRARLEIAKEMESVDLPSVKEEFDRFWDDLHPSNSSLPGLATYEDDDEGALSQRMSEAFDVSFRSLANLYSLY